MPPETKAPEVKPAAVVSVGSAAPTRTPGDDRSGDPRVPEHFSMSERREAGSIFQLVNQQPGRHYRFVRYDDMTITKARLKGYTFVKADDPEDAKPLVPYQTGPDNTIRMGDTVLMWCHQALFEQGRRDVRKRGEDLLTDADRQVEEAAKQRGIRTIRDKE